jgi:hypothetical protein
VLGDSAGMNRPNRMGRRVVYRCDRWGKPQIRKKEDIYESRKRANTGSRKCNCPFLIEAQELPSGQWRGRMKVEFHNHDPSDQVTSYPSHRKRALEGNEEAQATILRLLDRRAPAAIIKAELKAMGVHVRRTDIYNIRSRIRGTQLGGTTSIQWLANTLKERAFFVRIDTAKDNENRVTRLFFAHPKSIELFK